MNKKIVRLFFSALVACSTAAAWAWGDSDWGFSDDYLEDALETDRIWRSMEASQNAVRLFAGGSASRARGGDVPAERKNVLYAGEAGTTQQVIDPVGWKAWLLLSIEACRTREKATPGTGGLSRR